jgi:hypothetical protein
LPFLQGINIRHKSTCLISLFGDQKRIEELREKSKSNRNKYTGLSSAGEGGGGGGGGHGGGGGWGGSTNRSGSESRDQGGRRDPRDAREQFSDQGFGKNKSAGKYSGFG